MCHLFLGEYQICTIEQKCIYHLKIELHFVQIKLYEAIDGFWKFNAKKFIVLGFENTSIWFFAAYLTYQNGKYVH